MAEDTLLYREMTVSKGYRDPISGTGRVGFGNLAKDYAALNRKNMRHTDNKGYPLCYVVEVEAIGDTSNPYEIEIFTAPETWVLKNAVRKWHIAREEMLKRNEALGKVGEYGRTIRPYLTVNHAKLGVDINPTQFKVNHETTWNGPSDSPANTEQTSAAVAATGMNGGEWTYTRVANEGSYDSGEGTGNMAQTGPPVDTYALCLTGDHDSSDGVATSSMTMYTHVSMMRSYLESRRNPSTIIQDNSGGGAIMVKSSPLADLLANSLSATEAREIIQDIQREKPPYDNFSTSSTDALTGNDALDLVSKCLLSTSTSYVKDKEVIRIPMGLFHVRSTATATLAAGGGSTPGMRFRLLGIDKCQG
jgi:hypothetical protein